MKKLAFIKDYSFIILALICLAYFIIHVGAIDGSYIDFGDGNYLYIVQRLTDGLTLYHDIISPQPPFHLFSGVMVFKLAELINFNRFYAIRIFSILLHLAIVWLVALVARRISDENKIGALAGLLYLVAPYGYWWSQGYQSEPLELVFLTGSFYCLLSENRKSVALGAVLGACALFTNMTALPYLVLHIIYFATVRRKDFPTFMLTLTGSVLLFFAIFHIYSHGTYLQNVWSNQVGTFPKENTLRYIFVEKIWAQGLSILFLDGILVATALVGMLLYLGDDRCKQRGYVVWYTLFGMGSILFVGKGGTMDYIFCLAEPMAAVLAAYFLFTIMLVSGLDLERANWLKPPWPNLTRSFILALLLFCILASGLRFDYNTLKRSPKSAVEYGAEEVAEVEKFILENSEPGDLILAPPFYAFITGRTLPAECSSTFIWFIRWAHDQKYMTGDEEIHEMIGVITRALDEKKVKVVLLNQGQFGQIPEIRYAVERNYERYQPRPEIRSRNERLQVYLPKK